MRQALGGNSCCESRWPCPARGSKIDVMRWKGGRLDALVLELLMGARWIGQWRVKGCVGLQAPASRKRTRAPGK